MDQIARTPQQIGAFLRRVRKQKQMSQTALAQKVGLRQATISAIENGEAGTLGTLSDILVALNLELVIRERSVGKAIEDIF